LKLEDEKIKEQAISSTHSAVMNGGPIEACRIP